ncbi:MAG: aspartate/glutamate racemase family protein [Solirubrobacteraceae bacterium]
MRTIGVLGGMSSESSADYYRVMNQTARARLGGVHSARTLMLSFDFGEIEALQAAGRWDESARLLADGARALERGGAELLIIATNTMHEVADQVAAAVTIPLIHIADPTAARIRAAGLTRVGLLGTRYTMERPFYRGRMEALHGLAVIVPGEADRTTVHDIIYSELVVGVTREASRERYREVIGRLVEQGAEGVIYGCTEIELLVGAQDSPVPVFDTARIHAEAAVDAALATPA